MELRHLRAFVAVAEELHFGRAARRLGVAQPPLSQLIRRLERDLGVALFTRTNRRVALTEAGAVLLPEARRIARDAEAAVDLVRRAQRGEVGRLTLGFVGSATDAVLPAILRAYRAECPEVMLDLRQLTSTEQAAALRAGALTAGLLRPPLDPTHAAALAGETLLREPLVVALPHDHRLAGRGRVALKDLAGEPWILYPRERQPATYDQILAACRRAGFAPRVVQEAVEMQTIAGLVAAGLGVSLVPASVAGLRPAGVVYRPLPYPAPFVELTIAWRRDDDSALLAGFLATVRRVAAEANWREGH
jgi:DNA-binding transcriptional LysR family regulator